MQIICRNDCTFMKNGRCTIGQTPTNSIFDHEKRTCIYFSKKWNKTSSSNDFPIKVIL